MLLTIMFESALMFSHCLISALSEYAICAILAKKDFISEAHLIAG